MHTDSRALCVLQDRELRHWGHSTVPLVAYAPLALAASRALGFRDVHVQTVSGCLIW